MRKLTVAAFATACIGAAWGWTSGTVDGLLDSSQGAIPECEESLKSTLASPSSYRRIHTEFVSAPQLNLELYKIFELTKGCGSSQFGERACIEGNVFFVRAAQAIALKELGQANLKGRAKRDALNAEWRRGYDGFRKAWPGQTASVAIEYDADNEYGASLRNSFVCHFGRKSSKGFSKADIFVPSAQVDKYL